MDSIQAANEIRKKKITALVVVIILAVGIAAGVFVWTNNRKTNYEKAIAAFNQQDYAQAIQLFESLNGYQDSSDKLQESHYRLGASYLASGKYDQAESEFKQAGDYGDASTQANESVYRQAVEYFVANDYDEAIWAFDSIGGYRDAEAKAMESRYNQGVLLISNGDYDDALNYLGAAGDYPGALEAKDQVCNTLGMMALDNEEYAKAISYFDQMSEQSYESKQALANSLSQRISYNYDHIVAINSSGTAVYVGNSEYGSDFDGMPDLTQIVAGEFGTIAHTKSGTIIASGLEEADWCSYKISGWNNVVKISAWGSTTVGLTDDGFVYAIGECFHNECDASSWSDIVDIATGAHFVIGKKRDGSIVTSGNAEGLDFSAEDWKNVTQIAGGGWHCVGLKKDGTVIATGANSNGQCDVEGWSDIIYISAGATYTVGLKRDGTIVVAGNTFAKNANGETVGYDFYSKYRVDLWEDIVALSPCSDNIIGVMKNGRIVHAGKFTDDNATEIDNWVLF